MSCLTDFLDGFIARKFNLTSPFGAFLDPVADKVGEMRNSIERCRGKMRTFETFIYK